MRAGTALLKVNTLTCRLGETRNRTAPELKRSRCVSVTRLKLDMFRGCEYSGRALITLKEGRAILSKLAPEAVKGRPW